MFGFLWRSSWRMIVLVTVIGILSGLVSAGLVEQINLALSSKLDNKSPIDYSLLGHFLGLCALVLISGYFSKYSSIRLGEKTICQLRIQLSRLIINATYPKLQGLGKSRILANLTGDVGTVSHAFLLLPELCVNAAMVSGCLAYLGWLSWRLALITIAFVLFGTVGYKLLAKIPNSELRKLGRNSII